MSNSGLVPTCVCATPYQSTATGYRFCPNCDRCQDVERAKDSRGRPLKRVPTQADRRFTLAWEKRKREIYGTP